MKKRVLSALLVLCLACGLVSTAWAADGQATPETAAVSVTDAASGETAQEETTSDETVDASAYPARTVEQTVPGTDVTVQVDVPAGALPEDAELITALVGSSEDAADDQAVADVAAELDAADVEYDGFVALDISFVDADGNKVEPLQPVSVNFTLPAELLPEDVDASTLEVQHLEENAAGEVENVATVADTADVTEGTVTVDGAAVALSEDADTTLPADAQVTAEFDVDGFSSFVITWNNYKAATEIETVPTVDSTAEGVHMYMFNYNYPAFSKSIASYEDGSTKENIASLTTDANGWPNLQATVGNGQGASNNPSFSTFFGNVDNAFDLSGNLVLPDKTFWNGDRSDYSRHYLQYKGQEVNHLFLKDKFDEDGTFYYSSFENFATLKNDGDNNFTVYDALGTPSGEDQYYFKRGNFMPYNTLNTSDVPWHNRYSETGTELQPGDPGYNDPVYGLNEEADFYFGMYVWADFYQPKDGVVESNDEPMVFEFTGDDDMWVYIDGVLVLDLGGIHDAQSGSINFATGKITWTDTPTKDHTNPGKYQKTSTLLEKYQDAHAADKVDWDGKTFADGSNHRIQIFYMERGDGASNLKISFNLKTIPDGQFSVRKDVENYYAPQMADIEYTMQAFVDGKPYANKEYTLFEKEGGGTTNEKGCFKIKADETAVFTDLTVGNKITVKEVGCSELPSGVNVDQAYEISYTVTDGSGQTVDGGEDNKQITATMPGYGSINVVVTNTATFTRPLKLVKNFEGTTDNAAPENFDATYNLYEVNGSTKELIGSVKYSELKNGEYIFWLETGKSYTIEETFENGNNGGTDDLPYQGVTVTTNDPADGTQASQGIVTLETSDATIQTATSQNPVDTITLTNRYGESKATLTLQKTFAGLTDEDVYFLLFGQYALPENPTEDELDDYYNANFSFDVNFCDTSMKNEGGDDDHWMVKDEPGHSDISLEEFTKPGTDEKVTTGDHFKVYAAKCLDNPESAAQLDQASNPEKGATLRKNDQGDWVYTQTIEIPVTPDDSATESETGYRYFYTVYELHGEVPGYAKLDPDSAVYTVQLNKQSNGTYEYTWTGLGKFVQANTDYSNIDRANALVNMTDEDEQNGISQNELARLHITSDTTISFTNCYTDSLSIQKEVTENDAMPSDELLSELGNKEYTIKIAPADTGKLLTSSKTAAKNGLGPDWAEKLDGKSVTVERTREEGQTHTDQITFNAQGEIILKLYRGEKVTLKDIPAINYRITEITPDGKDSTFYDTTNYYLADTLFTEDYSNRKVDNGPEDTQYGSGDACTEPGKNNMGPDHWNQYGANDSYGYDDATAAPKTQDGVVSVDVDISKSDRTSVDVVLTNDYEHFKTVTITKHVGGEMGAKDTAFNFTTEVSRQKDSVTYSKDVKKLTVNGGKMTLTGAGSSTEVVDITIGNAVLTDDGYQLSHGDVLTIDKLKKGDTITIVEDEANQNGYDSTYTINETGEKTSIRDAITVTLDDTTLSGDKDNDHMIPVDVYNDRPVVTPTGLESNHTTPYTILVTVAGIAGLALIGGIVARCRRRRRME